MDSRYTLTGRRDIDPFQVRTQAAAVTFGIDTPRLELRQLTLADAPLMLAVWNDPAFIRFVGDRGIRTVEDAEDAMTAGALKLYGDYGYGPYGVVLRG